MDDRYGQGPERRERGFFDRAADEVRTWLGDDDAEHRRERDSRVYGGGYGPETRTNQDRASQMRGGPTPPHRDDYRGRAWGGGARGREGGSYHGQPTAPSQANRVQGYGPDQSYGDFGRTENGYRDYQAAYGNSHPAAETGGQSHHDEGYRRWREQQIRQMDDDYAEYQRERQRQFENDFGGWRGSRQQSGSMSGSAGGSGLASGSGTTLSGPTGQSGDSVRTAGAGSATTHSLGQEGAGATTAAQGSASAATASTGSSGPLIGNAENADQTSSSSTSRKAKTTS